MASKSQLDMASKSAILWTLKGDSMDIIALNLDTNSHYLKIKV